MYVACMQQQLMKKKRVHEFEKGQGVVYGKIWKEDKEGEMIEPYNLKK